MIVHIYKLEEQVTDWLNHEADFEKLVREYAALELSKVSNDDLREWTLIELQEYAFDELCIEEYSERAFWNMSYSEGIYVDNMERAEEILCEQFTLALKDEFCNRL